MDVMKIVDKVAKKYGLHPDRLEAGTYTKSQSTVLVGLLRTASDSQKDEDWEAYLEQKAKYLKGMAVT